MSPNKWPVRITLSNRPDQSRTCKNLDVWVKLYNGLWITHMAVRLQACRTRLRGENTRTRQILEKHLSETDFLCLQVSVCGLWPQGFIFGEIRPRAHAFVSLTRRRRLSGWFHAHPRATPLQMSRLRDPWILWCLYICVCVFICVKKDDAE